MLVEVEVVAGSPVPVEGLEDISDVEVVGEEVGGGVKSPVVDEGVEADDVVVVTGVVELVCVVTGLLDSSVWLEVDRVVDVTLVELVDDVDEDDVVGSGLSVDIEVDRRLVVGEVVGDLVEVSVELKNAYE